MFLLILTIIFSGCETTTDVVENQEQELLFSVLPPSSTGIDFVNNLKEGERMNGLFYEYFYNGGGVAVGDVNNDGLVDIYFTSNLESNKLYINKGGIKFEDVTQSAGVKGKYGFATGVTMVDINQDGLLDIYICKSGQFKDADKRRNELYVNQGVDKNGYPVFEEQASIYGIDIPAFSTQATFFDYDRDNDLDMFLINHGIKSFEGGRVAELALEKSELRGERLYENENGHYHDVTDEAGIINNNLGYCLGVGISDLNNDQWPDIYVSVDYSGKDHLYLNNQDGTFTESILLATKHISNFSMGNDMADFNNDGWTDIMTVDMASEHNYQTKASMGGMNPRKFHELVALGQHHQYMYNALQMNRGYAQGSKIPLFSEVAQIAGVAKTDWSWAPLIFDMDNDGLKDIFISNGIKRDFRNNDYINYKKQKDEEVKKLINNKEHWDISAYVSDLLQRMPQRKSTNYFYKNEGSMKFSQWNDGGMDKASSSNGAAYADFDKDGDLDLVVNNADDPAIIYRNNTDKGQNSYLLIKLMGPKGNRNGIGARVKVVHGRETQYLEQYLSRGFQSSVDRVLHFGLGEYGNIDTLQITWPDGRHQVIRNVKGNQTITLDYEDALHLPNSNGLITPTKLFEDITRQSGLNHKHNENEYDDFLRESLLPHKMSQFGPALAVGDVNQDGLQDFYVGGAIGEMGTLYWQTENSTFRKAKDQPWRGDQKSEDVGAVFFDADNDKDLDLYVVSGGSEYLTGDEALQDRLYINNGNGGFSKSQALPLMRGSGSKVVPTDFDLDGDIDLFIGGRLVPGKYPFAPRSYLLRNELNQGQAKFIDVTEEIAPALMDAGMVTDAVWADFNGDALPDLAVTGEWMSIKVLLNEDKAFEDRTTALNLHDVRGWWFGLKAFDMDQDGDLDLVAGNLGLNYKYQASAEAPFEIFTRDFDENGALDIVLGYHDQGNLYPLRGRECSSAQMPFIKTKYPTYDKFAKAKLDEVYGVQALEGSLHYQVTHFSSTYFENVDGRFEASPLPPMAQISAVNSIVVNDVNTDGIQDLILAGNLHVSEVETTRNDAGLGLLLLGDGKGNFNPVSSQKSGLFLDGDIRYVLPIKLGRSDQLGLLVAKNDGYLQLVKINHKKTIVE